MSVSVAVPTQRAATRTSVAGRRTIYGAALIFWLLTRGLVLVHQGAWPWMNAFVVAAARDIVVGDWNDAVRPQLPAVLGVPLVLAGASEQQMVAVLYLLASVVQFGAFVVLIRTIFANRLDAQTMALLAFLVLPFNHSIHHYRDMPVVLASAAIFLLSADFIRQVALRQQPARADWLTPATSAYSAALRSRWRWLEIGAAMFLGVWSRIEIVTFVGMLAVVALLIYRRHALGLAATYLIAAGVVTGSLLVVYRLENVDLSQAWFYTAHTFLDSTPDSWLTPACQANPTENCREADGLTYFGPADLRAGVLALALNHPLTTLAKSARSGWDNAWVLVGPNLSTFPATLPFVVLVVAAFGEVRAAYRAIPKAVWVVVAAIMAESVLPPLTWAPPHAQYHVALVAPMVILLVPALMVLLRTSRARWLAIGFLVANAALSAFRYTRYAGY